MNNFFTPIFRLTKHHPLPWVPLRAIHMPIEPPQAFPSRHLCPAASGIPRSSDDLFLNRMTLLRTHSRQWHSPALDACSVKVLSAMRSMHCNVARRVQAFFNNGARSHWVNAGNSRPVCPANMRADGILIALLVRGITRLPS